jgi:hypothetical protein
MMPPSPPRVIIDHRPRDFWSVKNHPLSGITSAQWARMVWRHGGSMDVFTYWPRLLFITCMSVLNSFFALCDWLVYGRAVANQQLNDEPVFVLGHPRTGTTHLHNLLSKDERFAFATTFSVGFPSSFLCLRAVAPAIGLLMDSTRPMDNMSLAWDTPQEDVLAMNQMSSGTSPYAPLLFPRKEKSFRPFYRFLLARTGSGEDSDLELEDADAEPCDPKDFERWRRAFILFLKKTQYAAGGARKRLLLKSPVHTARVRLIKSLFPKATFVFIHRHPLEVFRSAAHMADAYYWQCYLQRPRALDVQEFIKKTKTPRGGALRGARRRPGRDASRDVRGAGVDRGVQKGGARDRAVQTQPGGFQKKRVSQRRALERSRGGGAAKVARVVRGPWVRLDFHRDVRRLLSRF